MFSSITMKIYLCYGSNACCFFCILAYTLLCWTFLFCSRFIKSNFTQRILIISNVRLCMTIKIKLKMIREKFHLMIINKQQDIFRDVWFDKNKNKVINSSRRYAWATSVLKKLDIENLTKLVFIIDTQPMMERPWVAWNTTLLRLLKTFKSHFKSYFVFVIEWFVM